MEYEASDDDSSNDDASTRTDTEREDNDVDQSHYRHVFTIISENIPTFNSDLKKFKKNPKALESLCNQMSKSLGFACLDDIRILHEDGLDYVASTQPNNDLMSDIPPYLSKPTYHGTIQNFTNGSLRVTADQLCLFMYCNYTIDYENLMDGLLCSDLIKMHRHGIAYSKTPNQLQKAIASNTCKENLKKTYMRWFLSDVEDWRKNNGRVNKETFYYTIIDMFKNKDMKDWSESVLQEWNKDMFQNKKKYKT
ncbi:hypothetical protein BGW80DRAFT_1256111 [Lactifluus volemus]|nr:hypothetical protein BGW80DRAFT_1256111 [Lactifluus volemus]